MQKQSNAKIRQVRVTNAGPNVSAQGQKESEAVAGNAGLAVSNVPDAAREPQLHEVPPPMRSIPEVVGDGASLPWRKPFAMCPR